METKFNKGQLNVVAAHFARTNMGQSECSVGLLRRMLTDKDMSLGSAVNVICGEFIESQEHYHIFMSEARAWLKEKRIKTLESVKAVWPDHGTLFEQALKQEVK